jgi:3-oxoacyl-[acyl-carrier protein] reductase
MKQSKNIIITGTSRGIGFELVNLFANQGHNVLALSRNTQPVRNLQFDNISSFAFDLCEEGDYKKVEAFIQKEWKHVDILINNAGMLLNKPFAETSFKDFSKVYNTNVFGVSEMTRIVLPCMKFPGLAAYSSSKAAVITLTELLAEEYKETGPQFNVLALGAVQTEMLKEAFPDYQAPTTALEMATYINEFSLNGNTFYNGKVLQVSNSTP